MALASRTGPMPRHSRYMTHSRTCRCEPHTEPGVRSSVYLLRFYLAPFVDVVEDEEGASTVSATRRLGAAAAGSPPLTPRGMRSYLQQRAGNPQGHDLNLQQDRDGPGRDRTCDLGIKSLAGTPAANGGKVKQPATTRSRGCSELQDADANGDTPVLPAVLLARSRLTHRLWSECREKGRVLGRNTTLAVRP